MQKRQVYMDMVPVGPRRPAYGTNRQGGKKVEAMQKRQVYMDMVPVGPRRPAYGTNEHGPR